MRKILYSAMAAIISASAAPAAVKAPAQYPVAPVDASVVDEYFGVKVADPYRPLENDTAAVTAAWVEAERKVTEDYLSRIPFRNRLREQISQFNNYAKQGTPWRWNDGKYYFFRNDGLKNQSVLYRLDTLDAEPVMLLDPNALSDDGTVALTGLTMSPDGK